MKRGWNFHEMYAETYEGLMQYVSRRCKLGDVAEDIIQETYYEALLQYDDLQGHVNLRGWLYRTASNKMNNYIRKYGRESTSLEGVEEKGKCDVRYWEVEWKAALAKILNEEDTEIFWAYIVLGYSGREMANRLGIKESCFRCRIHRIKKQIRQNLER